MNGPPAESRFRARDRIADDAARVEKAADAVRSRTDLRPRAALVLGSGLDPLAGLLAGGAAIGFTEIPGFPPPGVRGHPGRLVLGRLGGLPLAVQVGRLHVYEGHSASETALPLRVMAALGARILVVLNSSGGLNRAFEPGDIMLIEDHLNLQFRSPLRGRGPLVDGDRFVDMAEPYSRRLFRLARSTALDLGIDGVHSGIYCGVLGPSYETRSEVAVLRKLGGDAVGMSTVAEVIAARHAGMEVLGLSCISNMATGLSPKPLAHEDVIRTAGAAGERMQRLVCGVLGRLKP